MKKILSHTTEVHHEPTRNIDKPVTVTLPDRFHEALKKEYLPPKPIRLDPANLSFFMEEDQWNTMAKILESAQDKHTADIKVGDELLTAGELKNRIEETLKKPSIEQEREFIPSQTLQVTNNPFSDRLEVPKKVEQPTQNIQKESWATDKNGWNDKSMSSEGVAYKIRHALNTLYSVIFGTLGQLVGSTKMKSSEFMKTNDLKTSEENKPTYEGLAKKLLDARGFRQARLDTNQLGLLADAIVGHPPKAILKKEGFSRNVNIEKLSDDQKPSNFLTQGEIENAKKGTGEKILIPFVWPPKGKSETHIVLVTVDPERKEIRYFDPKGLHSNDPSRIGALKDFNMRKDLEKLQNELGDGWKLKENTKTLQLDPTNCGPYVARAIEDEVNDKPVGKDWKSGPMWINEQKHGLLKQAWSFAPIAKIKSELDTKKRELESLPNQKEEYKNLRTQKNTKTIDNLLNTITEKEKNLPIEIKKLEQDLNQAANVKN